MIETETLDLTDGSPTERSNDDHHAHQPAVMGSGHPILPGRPPTPTAPGALASMPDIADMTPKEDLEGRPTCPSHQHHLHFRSSRFSGIILINRSSLKNVKLGAH